MKREDYMKIMLRMSILFIAMVFIIFYLVYQPQLLLLNKSNQKIILAADIDSSSSNLMNHVKKLSVDFHPRNHSNMDQLNNAKDYIKEEFSKSGCEVSTLPYDAREHAFENVMCIFKSKNKSKEIVVVGAHYDSFDITPGADDNASGVAGIIEIAKHIGELGVELDYDVEIVAYASEEPPFFRSKDMGSYHHATNLKKSGLKVKAVIILEMIGYFTKETGTQDYPASVMKAAYPTTGDFVAIVGRLFNGSFVKKVKSSFKATLNQYAFDGPVAPNIYSINAPMALRGVDFSDHQNYWIYDMPAVMITDTAFYRNKSYHTKDDKYDTLNYVSMARIVDMVFNSVISM